MIKLNYKGKDQKDIYKLVFNAFKEVDIFFKQKPKEIKIFIHNSRKDFDNRLNRKTQNWEIANASYSGEIDIMHPNILKKESTHSKEDFLPILKHEFSHIFLDKLSANKKLPRWLDEGLSSYIAGFKPHKDIPVIENFCELLGTPDGWNDNVEKGAYKIATAFVENLVNSFSKKKVIKLISSLDQDYSFDEFKKKFEMVFLQKLIDCEKIFITKIKK